MDWVIIDDDDITDTDHNVFSKIYNDVRNVVIEYGYTLYFNYPYWINDVSFLLTSIYIIDDYV